MGFSANHTISENKPKVEVVQTVKVEAPVIEPQPFTKQELEVLLRTMAEANLKGKEVELFYNVIIKLQDLYIQA